MLTEKKKLYYIWYQMCQQCQNPRHAMFPKYGAAGVSVCDRWKSFDAFIEDMGTRPTNTKLGRVNDANSFSPDNCHWTPQDGQRHLPLDKRISKRTVIQGDCLVWNGVRDKDGYAVTQLSRKQYRVSRLVWEGANGAIPAGLLICHACDNPPCVNIGHLFLGTSKDNTQDMIAKGRGRKSRIHHLLRQP